MTKRQNGQKLAKMTKRENGQKHSKMTKRQNGQNLTKNDKRTNPSKIFEISTNLPKTNEISKFKQKRKIQKAESIIKQKSLDIVGSDLLLLYITAL